MENNENNHANYQPPQAQVSSNEVETTHKNSSRFKNLLISIVITVFTMSAIFGYMIYSAPRAYAQEYLENISEDIAQVSNEMEYFLNGFDDLTASVDETREAFYEITSTKSYEEAKIDTKEDITTIINTIELINSTRDTKSQYNDLPNEFIEFNKALDSYLDQNNKALDILLTHQEFKQEMLEASGDDFNTKINELTKKVANDEFQAEDFELFKDISSEASAAVERFESLIDVPVTEKGSYELKIEYHAFIALKFDEVYKNVSSENPDIQIIDMMFNEINDYVMSKNEQVNINAEKYVTESDIVELFKNADTVFSIMNNETAKLNEKFNAEVSMVVVD